MIKCGALPPIIKILNDHKDNKQRVKVGTWALSNCCRGKPLPDFESIKITIPTFCSVLLRENATETLCDASWAMSYLSDGDEDVISTIINTGVISGLKKHLVLNT